MTNHKHRGMLLESIINKTINYYNTNKIGYFCKNNFNIKFSSINKMTLTIENGTIAKRSTVDYYGIFKGKYISFEAKSTETKTIPINNFKIHQHEHLKLINSLGGIAFYIFLFKFNNSFYIVDINKISLKKRKSISFDEIDSLGMKMDIVFPGIIDFLSVIKI